MKHASTLIAVAVAGLLAFLAPAQHAVAQAGITKMDFAGSTTWLGQAPVMVAIEKGYFKEQGLEVTFRTILASSDRVRAVTSGDVVFSNLGRSSVISEMARGNQSFYYFANIDDSPGNEGCWSRPGLPSFKDLKGKKIAANTSAEITMNGLLAAAGMTVKDVQFVNLPPNEMAGALSKGDVDAACVWQPLLDGLKAAAPGGTLLGTDMDTTMYKKYGTMASPDIVIISKKFVDEHPQEATKLTVAMFKGADFVKANPEETAKIISTYFKKPPEELIAGVKSFKYFGTVGWAEHMKLHQAQMQELADWLYETGKIPTKPVVANWANYSFIPK
jgi:ABC-type nitrate/sulfonate/bicarbonate transport system substrate-binding protein